MTTQTTQSPITAFAIAETKERAILTRLFKQKEVTDYSFTKVGSKERYDFQYTRPTDGKEYIGDIKCRNIKSTDYDTALFNQSKIDWLFNAGYRTNKVPLIIAHYTDGVIAIWSISKEISNMKATTRQCTNTTSGTSEWDSERVANPVYLLKLESATKIQLI